MSHSKQTTDAQIDELAKKIAADKNIPHFLARMQAASQLAGVSKQQEQERAGAMASHCLES